MRPLQLMQVILNREPAHRLTGGSNGSASGHGDGNCLDLRSAACEAAVASIHDGFLVVDHQARILICNPAAATLLGLPPGPGIPGSLGDLARCVQFHDPAGGLLAPGDWPVARALHGEVIRDLDLRITGAQLGEPLIGSHSASPVYDAAGGLIGAVCTIREATARYQLEERLRESERRLKALIDNAPTPIFYKNAHGQLVVTNPQLESLFGMEGRSMVGKTDFELFSRELAEHFTADDREVLESGQVHSYEESLPKADSLRTYITTKFPIRDAEGRTCGLGGISTEITERKRAEQALEAANRELARSNTELEQFASIISHDLRCPLVSLSGSIQLLEEECQGFGTEAHETLGFIKRNVDQMGRLITSLLDYARVGRGGLKVVPCRLDGILSDVVGKLRAAIQASGAQITHDPLPVVQGDTILLAELLQNLLENAIKYRGDDPPRVHVSSIQQTDSVIVTVADNGIGITPEHLDRIFLVLHRAHADESRFPGLGMGLATCKKIVEKHGGRIWVESRPGVGATFSFTLPALSE